jgi:transcriptional regulator with XRE-family HTH domain
MCTPSNRLRRYRHALELSLEALASSFNVNKSTVLRWEEGRIPAERVLDVERITGIPRHELRPDLYRPERVA